MSYDPRFLAHAVALEEEAMQRYRELSESLATHNNPVVADFFASMSEESARHLSEVEALADGQALPRLAAWEFDWPGEAPESTSYEALHYRMDLRSAMELALANERAARDFYREAAERAPDPATADLARRFADEEQEHAQQLLDRIKETPTAPDFHREDDDSAQAPE